MHVAERTIGVLTELVTGTSGKTGYRSGPRLVAFFNELGFDEAYGAGFPSRDYYAANHIRGLNDSPALVELLELLFDPLAFLPGTFSVAEAVDFVTPYLRRDGFQLVYEGDRYRVRSLDGNLVATPEIAAQDSVTHEFIRQQLTKCDAKIQTGDFDGAITNARSLLEAVLKVSEVRLTGGCAPYGGDLTKLYRRVQKLLALDQSSTVVGDAGRQVLSGLFSVVNGLAAMRNEMSDAHAASAPPTGRDAMLAVNAAKTLAGFVHQVALEAPQQTSIEPAELGVDGRVYFASSVRAPDSEI